MSTIMQAQDSRKAIKYNFSFIDKNIFESIKNYIYRILIGAVIIVLWSISVRIGLLDKFYFSSPEAIFSFLYNEFRPTIWENLISTIMATITAFAMSGIFGILIGLILHEFAAFKRVIDPFLTAINSLPRIALAPIFILWFGIGMTSKVALGFSLGVFIVLTSTIAGMKNVDPILGRLAKTLGCSGWQRFKKIDLPWAVPSVFAGLKLSLIYCFLGVVTSEMLASKLGLGQLIMYYSGVFRMDAVLGILVVMAFFAVLFASIADFVEERLIGDWIEKKDN